MAPRAMKPAPAEISQTVEQAVQGCTHEGQWQHAETVQRSGTFESTAYSVLFCKNCGAGKKIPHDKL